MSRCSGNTRRVLILAAGLAAMALAGCGGGNNSSPAPTPAPPPANNPPPVIGAAGGTVTEASGASVVVPAGALGTDTTIRVAMDSTGAPPLPAGLRSAGSVYVITPHGGDFAVPIEVRIPAPNVTLQPNQELKLAKAQPNEEWIVLEDSVLNAGVLSSNVSSFSFFTPVIITYALPLAQAEPMRVTTSLTCSPNNCSRAFGTVIATYTVTTNNGQLPENCTNSSLRIFTGWGWGINYSSSVGAIGIENTGGSLTRTVDPRAATLFTFGVGFRCTNSWSRYAIAEERRINWVTPPDYPNLRVLDMPTQVDVVEGLLANIDAVLGGGASRYTPPSTYDAATINDRAIIEWQRSDDSGASWRVIANSFQNEANPLPYGVGLAWRYWGVRHGFVATSTDQGALIRVRACYTPPPPDVAPPCVTSAPARLNVLQQGALPAIVTAPRSVLVRTGQTASLSVTASGAPAPTLQWQTRPANSSGAWSDVATGTGATTANYTTAVTALSDNGVQYRVVATNSVGSVASTPVTVSVSDLDVAPTIATQPASLDVTSGGDAVFAVDARGTEALSYQWRFNGTDIPGANSPVLRLTAVTNANVGSYAVTVSNGAGNVDSNEAILTVSAGAPVAVAPTIVTQPSDVTVNAGNTATFAVGVDGSGPLSFQWRRNGVAIPGATAAVLTLNSVGTGDAANYSVVVSNAASPAGVASASAALTMTANGAATAPSITTQPATLIVAPGGSGMLAVAATGSGPLSYQWLADGVPIGGKTEAVLVLTNVGASDEGRYSVRVSNTLGAVVSAEVDVILLGAPVVTTQPTATTVFENLTATFSVSASGSGLRYQWLRNGLVIPNASQAVYTTPPLIASDSGAVYSVIVFNGAGVVLSQSAVLTVRVPIAPPILQQPADVTIEAGTSASLCMAFGGTPPFSVQLNRWAGTEWAPIATSIFNDNGVNCIATPALQLADNGAQFLFFASNAESGYASAMTRTVTVTVTVPLVVTATTLASLSSTGATANNRSASPSLSADGRQVAFITDGTNLVPGFTNPPTNSGHAYVRNLTTGVTTPINQTPGGGQSTYGVVNLKLAAGGRYAVFSSLAGDLVADDTNGSLDAFVRDLQTGVTQRISLRSDGSEVTGAGNGVYDMQLDISADGRFVSFVSSHDLIGTDPPGPLALYLRDTQTGVLRRVASNPSYGIAYSALSSNGQHMAYAFGIPAPAPNVVNYYDVQANVASDLFTFDTSSGVDYLAQGLAISGNGRYVAFAMRSAPLLGGSTFPQVVVIDRTAPATLMIASTGSAGSGIGIGDGGSSFPKLSDDGRYVLFASTAPNLTASVAVGGREVLVLRDLQTQTTSVASRRTNGTSVQTASGVYNSHALSGDGTLLALAADESDMTGGIPDHQVYVAPRP